MTGTVDKQSGADRGGGGGRRVDSMERAMDVARWGSDDGGGGGGGGGVGVGLASPKLRRLICPFCGALTADCGRCDGCHARFDPLSRQASQNEMGPWFVRDGSMPFRPGCSYSTIRRLVESGGIELNSVMRGPSTRQFWMLAKHTPGVAQLLGVCHNCGGDVEADAFACRLCQEPFSADRDRQHMGLGPARPLPGRARVEILALHAEPPAGAELVSGPSAIPVLARETRGGLGRWVGDGGGDGEAGLEAIKRVDELGRAVESLKEAWKNERKRAWISVACAGGITVLAVLILLVS